MKNSELIPKVKEWLDANPEDRDLAAGALLVLQLTNNRIMYQNFMRKPKLYASRIEYELKKKYNFYLQQLTHEQVAEMGKQVEAIAKEHNLPNEHEEFKKGKRADHDALPVEIQALYAQNLSIMQQMRRCHTQLQLLSVEHSTCPDSERYPFLKELIDLDKQYHENWNTYDHFALSGDPTSPVVEDKSHEEAASPSAQDSADKSAAARPDSEPAMSEGTAEVAQADEQHAATPAASDQPAAIPAEPKKKTTRKTTTKKASK